MATQGRPRATQGRPMSTQGRPKSTPGRPKSTLGRPKAAPGRPRLDPRSPQVDPRSPQVDSDWIQVAPGRPQVALGRPRLDPRSPGRSRGSPKTASGGPKIDGAKSTVSTGETRGVEIPGRVATETGIRKRAHSKRAQQKIRRSGTPLTPIIHSGRFNVFSNAVADVRGIATGLSVSLNWRVAFPSAWSPPRRKAHVAFLLPQSGRKTSRKNEVAKITEGRA